MEKFKKYIIKIVPNLEEKLQKKISNILVLNICLNLALCLMAISKILDKYPYIVWLIQIFVGIVSLVSFLVIFALTFELSGKLDLEDEKEKDKLDEKKGLLYNLSDSKNIEIDKDVTLRYDPIMLVYILNGTIVFEKKIIYALLLDLAQRGLIKIYTSKQDKDLIFELVDKILIETSNDYSNISNGKYNIYSNKKIKSYENFILSKIIFNKKKKLSIKEIEKNISNGLYESRINKMKELINSMIYFEANNSKYISDSSVEKSFVISIILNILALAATSIVTKGNGLNILSLILNTIQGIIILIRTTIKTKQFSNNLRDVTISYLNNLFEKNIEQASNVDELINLTILSQETKMQDLYSLYLNVLDNNKKEKRDKEKKNKEDINLKHLDIDEFLKVKYGTKCILKRYIKISSNVKKQNEEKSLKVKYKDKDKKEKEKKESNYSNFFKEVEKQKDIKKINPFNADKINDPVDELHEFKILEEQIMENEKRIKNKF